MKSLHVRFMLISTGKIQKNKKVAFWGPPIFWNNYKSFYLKETDSTTAATDIKTIAAATPTPPTPQPGGKRKETELITAATAFAMAASVETTSVTSSSSLSTSSSSHEEDTARSTSLFWSQYQWIKRWIYGWWYYRSSIM